MRDLAGHERGLLQRAWFSVNLAGKRNDEHFLGSHRGARNLELVQDGGICISW